MSPFVIRNRIRLQALVLLLVLLAGGIAAPVSSAAIAHVSCGMECCQESGECCCLALRLAINDIDVGSADDLRIEAWQKQCGSNCATAAAGYSNEATPARATSIVPRLVLEETNFRSQRLTVIYDFLDRCQSSPRAPPSRF